MGKLIWHTAMSVDGFIAGADDAMEWIFEYDDPNPETQRIVDSLGAIICGRRSYDVGQKSDGPPETRKAYGGAWSGPTFLVTHNTPANLDPEYTAVSGDVNPIVDAALAAAKGKDVNIIGADVARQCAEAGRIDELVIFSVPMLLGRGVRLYEGTTSVELERISSGEAGRINNLRYRLIY